MKLTSEDAQEIRGYLRGKGLTIEQAALLIDRHRTTLSKKLTGASEITPSDLIVLGEQIALGTMGKHAGDVKRPRAVFRRD